MTDTPNARRLGHSIARAVELKAKHGADSPAMRRVMDRAGQDFHTLVQEERRKVEEEARQLRDARQAGTWNADGTASWPKPCGHCQLDEGRACGICGASP